MSNAKCKGVNESAAISNGCITRTERVTDTLRPQTTNTPVLQLVCLLEVHDDAPTEADVPHLCPAAVLNPEHL